MRPFIRKNRLYIAGLLLIIGTNVIIFSGIFLNRAGKPLSVITLTERELRQSYSRQKENSGLSLTLHWRVMQKESLYYGKWSRPEWLDAEKLTQLGFNIDKMNDNASKRSRRKRMLTKKVFIVLEYDGETSKEALKAIEENLIEVKADCAAKETAKCSEQAEGRLKREKVNESRLFAIDAGNDYAALRTKYYQDEKYIIAPGLIKPRYSYIEKKYVPTGSIKSICVEKIHVPLELKKTFYSITGKDKDRRYNFDSPMYNIELAYGQRYEPWIQAIHPIDKTQ